MDTSLTDTRLRGPKKGLQPDGVAVVAVPVRETASPGAQLYGLTGQLQPVGTATSADLDSARAALANTISAGLATDTRPAAVNAGIQESANVRFGQLDSAAQGQFTAVKASNAPGFISNSPIISDYDPHTPAWARGMATKAVGPFEELGNPAQIWVHIPLIGSQLVQIAYGSQVVAAVQLPGLPSSGQTSVAISQGSVWLDAQLLASTCPASSWTGFLVSGGTLTLGPYQVLNNQIVMNAGATFTIQANLAQPAPPPPTTGPGVDGSLVVATLPKTITVQVTQTAATITQLGDINATVYGTPFHIKRNAKAPIYNAALAGLFIPGDIVGASTFAFKTVKSTLFHPAGTVPILGASWSLPVAITTPAQLAQASGTGAAAISLGPGAKTSWTGLPGGTPMLQSVLIAAPGTITLWLVLPAATLTENWTLWNGKLRPSTLEFIHPLGGVVLYVSNALTAASAGELVSAAGFSIAHTDRPRQATGFGVKVFMPASVQDIFQTPAFPDGFLLITGGAVVPDTLPIMPFAIENALFEALPPHLMFAGGNLKDTNVIKGALILEFNLTAYLPTLPDPYASNIGLVGNPPGGPDKGTQSIGILASLVTWTAPANPILSFLLNFSQGSNAKVATTVETPAAERYGGLNILDVSSNADQFGINWLPRSLTNVQSSGMLLVGSGAETSIFTVSAISWEPMLSADPIPAPPSDGVPSKLNVPTVALAPIAPVPLMFAQRDSVAKGNGYSFIGTLPFGMIADVTNTAGPTYNFVKPQFTSYDGGYQLILMPQNPTDPKAEFPGQTILTDPYGTAVLSSDVATIFRADFSEPSGAELGVPVIRYDLSGYGASMFSHWADPNVLGTGILKVQFDVVVGRTAFEVVQAQSIIYPWGIKIVRTITIQRISGGDVTRKDSGWQAATPGNYNFPTNTAGEFNGAVHSGPVDGVVNVRNIRDNGAQFVLDGITYVPVLFDADVKINTGNPVVTGASQTSLVPSKDITGYAQLAPDNNPATRADLCDLLQQKGPAVAPIACTVNVGAAGQQMKVSSAQVSATGSGETAVFVASLNGAPVLPKDGQWSVAVKKGGNTPVALDSQTAVPLIQPNGDNTWHYADPGDILNLASPLIQYGFLQGTSTQKTFLSRPQIQQGANKVNIPDAPALADVGSLLGASGIFPDLAKALQFPSPQDLGLGALGSDTLSLNNLPPFTINQPPLTILDFGPIQVVLVYEDRGSAGNPKTQVTYKLDPTGSPAWSISFAKFTFVLVTPFGDVNDPLLQVVGQAYADANTAPKLTKLTVLYGSILSLVQQVFSKLDELASFLPGGDQSKLDVSLSNGKLTIADKFALPTLPLGLGDITNVALDLGASLQFSPMAMSFTAGISSPDQPFQWLVSPLSGTGCVVVGFNNADASILIQAGIGVGLSIDVGIASGSASIVVKFQVDNTVKPFEVKVILTGQASVDVLGGLASASLTLSAGLAIIPALPDITLIGSVAVGIHISICWVVNIDFDGSWQFSQTLKA